MAGNQYNISSRNSVAHQQFLHVETVMQLKDRDMFDADAMVIESKVEQEVIAMIQKIRRMRFKSFYLKPIFLSHDHFSKDIVFQTDGVIDFQEIEKIMTKSAAINERIQEVKSVNDRYNFKESALIKTLQFTYTRDLPFHPLRHRSAPLGYIFPFLSNLVSEEESYLMLDIIRKGEEEGCFDGKIIDKVNLCKNCNGGYLNFRESCTSCHSIDLESIELIHHFRCAYVGPATDFTQDHQLICPKCDKELRHIGIDYDKPSETNKCRTCGHQSQEAVMKALCIDCGTENELEYLQTCSIKNFTLTSFGKDLALGGLKKFDELSIPSNQDRRIVPIEVWKIMFNHEIERIQLKNISSQTGVVHLDEMALKHLDQSTREKIVADILLTMGHYLRKVDFVSARDLNTFLLLLPEIRPKEILALHELLEYNLQKLLCDNLGLEQINIAIQFEEINAQSKLPE